MTAITDLDAFEGVIGRTPPALALKVIDHLDPGALGWIAASRLMFAAFGDAGGLTVTLAGGAPGFVAATRGELAIPAGALDTPGLARPGHAFASILVVPGIGETLRVNGRVSAVAADMVRIAVAECYVHCAKALIRSDFWSAPVVPPPFADTTDFAAASRFMALATMDGSDAADLSPKGDPAGALLRIDDSRACFADRPGNRRVDGHRNILDRPAVALVALVPGASRVLALTGRARLETDPSLRAGFAVRGRTPALVTVVEDVQAELRESPVIARAGLWQPVSAPAGIDPARLLVAHVRANRTRGLVGRIAGAVVAVPGLMQRGLDSDYRSNLY